MAITPTFQPLPYVEQLGERPLDTIELVVLHCTELPDLATAREFGEKIHYTASRTGNSGHYYIDRDGSLYQWVPLARIAHHTRGFNTRSVGIELINVGRWPHWLEATHQAMDEPYTDAQIDTLNALLLELRRQLPALTRVAGHEDLDRTRVPASDRPDIEVARKRDPGPLFPWENVLQACGLQRIDEDGPV